jgi:Ala-tRNA(Pro) deacylase
MSTTCMDRLEHYLRANEVPYQLHHHPLAYTAQEVAASEHVPGRELAKTVVAFADGRTVMLVLPASYLVEVNKLPGVLHAKEARLAEEREFVATFPDCEAGAMPPFGNLYGLDVYVDQALAEDESIVFRAGTHTDTMRVAYRDFVRLVHPTTATIARHR